MYSRVQENAGNHQGILHQRLASKAAILVVSLLILSSITAFSSTIFSVNPAKSPEQTASTTTIAPADVTFNASPTSAFVGDEITFFANATSSDSGATLTFTIFYDYYDLPFPTINAESARTVNTTGSPGEVITNYIYDHPGNYTQSGRLFFWVFLFVADGSGSNISKNIKVFVNYNMPPVLKNRLSDPLPTSKGVPTMISALVADNDSDTVTVLWDFGDGTTETNVTVVTPAGVYVNQTHTWDPRIPGNGSYTAMYLLNLSLSDGFNPTVQYSTNVSVVVDYNYPPEVQQVLASQVKAYPLDEINFTASAYDAEGDPLTWTFNYSDGIVEVFDTGWTTPGLLVWQNTTHSFSAAGSYLVKVSVSDALIPYQVGDHNVTLSLSIDIIENVPPWVAPSIIADPGSPEINGTLGYVNVSLRIDVKDADGDVLTVTWDMGNGDIRTNTSQGGTAIYLIFQTLVFSDTGVYNITVNVTDGRAGHAIERNISLNVTSNNLPPNVLSFDHEPYAGEPGFAAPNESVRFVLILSDPEQDSLELVIDFGDGSPRVYMNLSDYSNGNITVTVDHAFAKIGNYSVRIYLTDNKMGLLNHTKSYQVPVRVYVRPPTVVDRWNWWDYTSLALFASMPILILIWFLRLRQKRKQIELQGMTYDEWKLRKEVDSEELK